jgi:hypothetical protein
MQDKCFNDIPAQSSFRLPTNKLGMVSMQKATHSLFRCNVLGLSQNAPHIFHSIYYLASQLLQDSFHSIFRVHQEIQISPFPPLWAVRVYSTSHQAIVVTEHRTSITTAPTSAPVSLHFITTNDDTADWPVSATVSRQSPLQSVYLAYSLGTYRFSSWITTANCFRYVTCSDRIHTAAAASLTVTDWTRSVLQYCPSTGHIPGWRKRRCYFTLSLNNHLLRPLRVERFTKHWWFDEGSYGSKAWFKYRDRIRNGKIPAGGK